MFPLPTWIAPPRVSFQANFVLVLMIFVLRRVKFTLACSLILVANEIAPPVSSAVTFLIVVFSIVAVAVLPVSKPIAPPNVEIDGPFHQEPAPVNVELVSVKLPPVTIFMKPPENVIFELAAVNVDPSTLRSLSPLMIAPPLIP